MEDFFKDALEELVCAASLIENDIANAQGQLEENERFIEILSEKDSPDFELFTPRSINTGDKEKLSELKTKNKELHSKLKQLQEQQRDNTERQSKLKDMLKLAEEKKETEEKSQLVAQQMKQISELIEKMSRSLKYIDVDKNRAKVELQQLVSS